MKKMLINIKNKKNKNNIFLNISKLTEQRSNS